MISLACSHYEPSYLLMLLYSFESTYVATSKIFTELNNLGVMHAVYDLIMKSVKKDPEQSTIYL